MPFKAPGVPFNRPGGANRQTITRGQFWAFWGIFWVPIWQGKIPKGMGKVGGFGLYLTV
jgi:hypothetical protein